MTDYDTTEVEGTDLEPRTERALTECMTVLPLGGDIYTVIGQNDGGEYRVDARQGRCTCPDYEHRKPAGGCKHIRRTRYATGGKPIPASVSPTMVDEQLGIHINATPRVAATDGGIIESSEEGEAPDRDGNERPKDCQCWNADSDLPCWPCWREGFKRPNPDEPSATDKEET